MNDHNNINTILAKRSACSDAQGVRTEKNALPVRDSAWVRRFVLGFTSSLRATRSNLILVLALLTGVGTAGAREWSEEIQVSHHDGEALDHDYQIILDPQGYYHLYYNLSWSRGMEANRRNVYLKIDQNGRQMSDTLDLVMRHFETMAIDSNENVYFISYEYETGFHFQAYDRNGDTLAPAHDIPELGSNWIDDHVRLSTIGQPSLLYSPDGTLVYASCWIKNIGQQNEEYIETLTRLTLEGEVIDSTFAIVRYDEVQSRSPIVRIDRDLNIHIGWLNGDIIGTWSTYYLISRDNEILIEDFLLQSYDSTNYDVILVDFVVDSQQNTYFLLNDINERVKHMQKLTPDGEIEWDRYIIERGVGLGSGFITIENDIIHVIVNQLDDAVLIGFDFSPDGDFADSSYQFVINSNTSGTNFIYTNNRLNAFYCRGNGFHNINIYLLREIENNVPIDKGMNFSSSITLNISPNPSNNIVRVTAYNLYRGNWQWSVFDITGRILLKEVFIIDDSNASPYSIDINTTSYNRLQSGAYYIVIQSLETGERYNGRFILVK